MGDNTIPSVSPLFSEPSHFEKTLMWQEQFLKGVAHGFQPQEWALITRVAIHAAKILANLNLESIEGIEDAHQRGYDLVCKVRHELSKYQFGVLGPDDK